MRARRRRPIRAVALVCVGAVAAAACSSTDTTPEREVADAASDDDATSSTTTDPDATTSVDATSTDPSSSSSDPTSTTVAESSLRATAGTEQLTIGAPAGTDVEIVDADGAVSASGTTDDQGALVVRGLVGGATYLVRAVDLDAPSVEVTTLDRDEHPPVSFYAEQRLPAPGYGYLTTRDGTSLAIHVVLPGPADAGPYPTVVEYSGYAPADPEATGLDALFTALGYAYVGVNMRGTGCSGGSFRYFEYAQSLDGYDAIETIADQPWVLDNRVGMVGVSYPGISQLFVAQTQPPSLAAITPLSIIEDSYGSTSYPGGILNTGFALEWIQQRQDEAVAAGQAWTADRIAAGDEQCEANQRLRGQNPDLVAELRASEYRVEPLASELAPVTFVDRIDVPVFVAGAWQDEQTGGRFATMLDDFTSSPAVYASLVNGLHIDSVSPAILTRMIEFLDLYVARRTPNTAPLALAGPLLAAGLFGTSDVVIPPDRFAELTFDEALAAFEAEPPIQVLFEHGAADDQDPRSPAPRFTVGFDDWPVPEAAATTWWLDDGGVLTGTEPVAPVDESGDDGDTEPVDDVSPEVTSYVADPTGADVTFWRGDSSGLWRTGVVWTWRRGPEGSEATFTTAPLGADTVVVGSGSVDLWIASTAADTDLEATVVEVRPDGSELYVQSGWLRASHRALDRAASDELRPVHTHRADDAAPLPVDELTPVRVELFPFAHVFRRGSSIRLIVDAPGGNRAVWTFDTIVDGETVLIAHDAQYPSRLVLPVVPDVEVPAGAPPCDSLRGQPCRPPAGAEPDAP